MNHVPHGAALLVLAVLAGGCGHSAQAEYPALGGRRVQSSSVVAHGEPFRVGVYELVFTTAPGADAHVRRAALLVDLSAGQGHARGFVEWGRAGEMPLTYFAGGWAHQEDVGGEPVTIFHLGLSSPSPRHPPRLALRVVVNEASGDVTLTRRH